MIVTPLFCLFFHSGEGVVFGERLAQVLSEMWALQQDVESWRPRRGMKLDMLVLFHQDRRVKEL